MLLAVPLVVLVIWIRFDSPGPAIFKQKRVGRKGKEFVCFKLRTMRETTAETPTHDAKLADITRSGAFLRRTKLDELPQLWNVIKGDMSLVGPRPSLPSQHELIEKRRLLDVLTLRPGITGVAQAAGVDMSDPERLAMLDATYVADQSFAHDLRILLATFSGRAMNDRIAP